MTDTIDTNENYEALSHAIIVQAMEDYKSTLLRLEELEEQMEKLIEKQNDCKGRRDDLERFFCSEWFSTLSGEANSEYIMKEVKKDLQLKKEKRNDRKQIRSRD